MPRLVPTRLRGVCLIEPDVFCDDRGTFFESYNHGFMETALQRPVTFGQDNHSLSLPRVLRGLHYQLKTPQAKLIRVVRGAIYDVAVDMRRASPTFGQWVGAVLSAENRHQIWIPEGFAHGFLTLGEVSEVVYKVSAPYKKDDEISILWNDKTLGISWPIEGEPHLSPKDKNALSFKAAPAFD
jgi:dTDP-4-dehydrorhamnose 3,5-epimerase